MEILWSVESEWLPTQNLLICIAKNYVKHYNFIEVITTHYWSNVFTQCLCWLSTGLAVFMEYLFYVLWHELFSFLLKKWMCRYLTINYLVFQMKLNMFYSKGKLNDFIVQHCNSNMYMYMYLCLDTIYNWNLEYQCVLWLYKEEDKLVSTLYLCQDFLTDIILKIQGYEY